MTLARFSGETRKTSRECCNSSGASRPCGSSVQPERCVDKCAVAFSQLLEPRDEQDAALAANLALASQPGERPAHIFAARAQRVGYPLLGGANGKAQPLRRCLSVTIYPLDPPARRAARATL